MFKVIFTQDVDITPNEAKEMQQMKSQPGGMGGMEIGVEPCAIITVGFIWPCGEMRIGGCGTILSKSTADIARLMGSVEGVKLDPEKNMEAIRKMAVLEIKSSDRE